MAGLAPRVAPHFTPTSWPWLNMVEIFFSIITPQAIRRGSFTSAKDLIAAIENFISGWNDRCHPCSEVVPALITPATAGYPEPYHPP